MFNVSGIYDNIASRNKIIICMLYLRAENANYLHHQTVLEQLNQ